MQPNLGAVCEQEVKEKAALSTVWPDVEGRAPLQSWETYWIPAFKKNVFTFVELHGGLNRCHITDGYQSKHYLP